MGSALTIVNNTDFDFHCNFGSDQAALGIVGIITAVVAALALIVVTGGTAAAPAGAAAGTTVTAIAAATGATITVVISSIAAAVTIAKTVAAAATVTSLLRVIVVENTEELESKGYRTIAPGGREKWDGFTLLL